MARPSKVGLDYFPTDVDFFSDEKIEFISAKFGLQGEAILIRLLTKIYRNGYYIEWNDDVKLLFASKLKGVDNIDELVDDVIEESLKRNFLNRQLFEQFGILTSRGIQKRFIRACQDSGRKNYTIEVNWDLIGVNSQKNPINSEITPVNSGFSTQSKVKESKVKESKGKGEKSKLGGNEPDEKPLPLTFETSSSLTSYRFTPTNYEDDEQLKATIILMLARFCKITSPEKAEVSRFFNIITKTQGCTRKTGHKITLETMKEYTSFEEKKRNLPYLSSKIEGKISDAIILGRERRAKGLKTQEAAEVESMAESPSDSDVFSDINSFSQGLKIVK